MRGRLTGKGFASGAKSPTIKEVLAEIDYDLAL